MSFKFKYTKQDSYTDEDVQSILKGHVGHVRKEFSDELEASSKALAKQVKLTETAQKELQDLHLDNKKTKLASNEHAQLLKSKLPEATYKLLEGSIDWTQDEETLASTFEKLTSEHIVNEVKDQTVSVSSTNDGGGLGIFN